LSRGNFARWVYYQKILRKGKFHRGIIQSGSNGVEREYDLVWDPIDRNRDIAKGLCNLTDAEWSNKQFQRLRQCMLNATWQELRDKLNLIRVSR
jgi:hypothetical protein